VQVSRQLPPIGIFPTQAMGTPIQQAPAPQRPARPEPRFAPVVRNEPAETAAGQADADAQGRSRVGSPGPPMRPRRRPKFFRLFIPLVFGFICGGVVFALISLLSGARAGKHEVAPDSEKAALSRSTAVSEIAALSHVKTPTVQPPGDLFEAISDTTPSPPPAVLAQAVLEKFLAATTLEERVPLMESKASTEELAASVLAAALPEVIAIDVDLQESPTTDQIIDIFFNVDFDDGSGTGKVNPQTVLVRIRGGQEPRVVADPILDLFGGRLADYAAAPQERAREFTVMANPMSRCWDEQVPNHEEKLTLKLMARDGPGEITRAYFGPQSEVARILENPGYASSLSYGQTRACTIVLQWNTQDDPQRPYLEVLRMKAFSWNP